MPSTSDSAGFLAYVAQMVRQADGTCPAHSRPDQCAADLSELTERVAGRDGGAD
jgi:hypothetical protein